ncbi:MAG: aquaporin [Candidatus Hydrogenedentes bacterium]|nr:aquaporin [Candidatus Hydrogenedentota bacterium]
MWTRLRNHFPEYVMEATLLGCFMISACAFATMLYHPASPVSQSVRGEGTRRALMGIAMGLTAVGLIHSPWGKQSGAHMNPAVTLTFYRLGKIASVDAIAYVAAQFSGAILGVLISYAAIGEPVAHRSVNFVVTLPGPHGSAVAFVAEAVMAFGMMALVLTMSNRPALARYTGVGAGCLVALYIAIEAPLSGMSINPARSMGSAVVGGVWSAIWIYLTAPIVGMALAAEFYVRLPWIRATACAKLHHQNTKRCIFCEYAEERQGTTVRCTETQPNSIYAKG